MAYGKVKPCPFCGWGTIVDGGFLNHRCQCNACGATTKGYPTWELAVDAWNKRERKVSINLNEWVKVKLTDLGKDIYYHRVERHLLPVQTTKS